MSLLDQIAGGKIAAPRRTMLYAVHGWGKSWFASLASKPIVIPTEEGVNDIACDAFFKLRNPRRCKTYAEFMACIETLYIEPSLTYQTVIVDTVDWLEKLIWAHVAKQHGVSSIAQIDYQRGYDYAITHWQDVLSGLDALRTERSMAIILLAHASTEKFRNPETDTYERFTPRLHWKASNIVQEWCDEVLFGDYKVYTASKDEGFNKTRVQGIGAGDRVIRTQERPFHVAKNRLGLPYEIALPADKSKAWSTYHDVCGVCQNEQSSAA
ncbi:MAG: ATP-binding protein [Acidobacteriales bacterium]|nr:ATP-binding protein [Terriglobales bacterium]